MTPAPLWKASVLLVFLIALRVAQPQSYIGSGSSWPVASDDVCVTRDIMVADNRSLCWYYQCVPAQHGEFKLIPKRCALGTHLLPSYKVGTSNPCSQRFPILDLYDCTRPVNAPEPVCEYIPNCTNGGKNKKEGALCWCDCPPKWQGAPDCSKATGPTVRPPPPSPCIADWCAKGAASLNGASPCLNGGICVNQCVNFVCNCTVPFTKTRYCEEFNCTTNNTCPTGEVCTRGLNGKDEFYVCKSQQNCADYLKQWNRS